jgi:hypothetical protein
MRGDADCAEPWLVDRAGFVRGWLDYLLDTAAFFY